MELSKCFKQLTCVVNCQMIYSRCGRGTILSRPWSENAVKGEYNMKRHGLLRTLLPFAAVLILLSIGFALAPLPERAAAQTAVPTIELAYDDGEPFKTVRESIGGCEACYTWQGVRFDLGGVALASITAVRFYAGGESGTLQLVITDASRQRELIDPIKVGVSAAQWYTVSVPETAVSEDFWVWLRKDGKAMPYHDIQTFQPHSYIGEHYKLAVYDINNGDLMIRAVVRAEIHVGEGQEYATIQEAVDAAGEGLAIIVHQGTYTENVVVNKKLAIMSKDGSSNTIVRAQNPGAAAFTITAGGALVSGFSIQGASGSGASAVHISDSSDCTVSSNNLSGNHYGVLISGNSRNNTILDNDVHSNVYGVWVDGQENNISGNRFEANTSSLGSGVYLSATAGDNEVHFNGFTADAGQVPQVYSDATLQMANCVNNWWGSAGGPYHATDNPSGTGATVGEGVRFSPWLKAEPVAVKSAVTAPGSYVVNATSEASTSLQKTGTGKPTVWVARYAGNPGGEFPQTAIAKWVDVYFNNTAGVQEVEIRVQYSADEVAGLDEGSLRLYWWNGTQWSVCSNSGINTQENYVWARLQATSNPGIGSLGGTPFAVGTTSGGFAWWLILAIIAGLILLLVVGRFVLGSVSRRREYYYEQ